MSTVRVLLLALLGGVALACDDDARVNWAPVNTEIVDAAAVADVAPPDATESSDVSAVEADDDGVTVEPPETDGGLPEAGDTPGTDTAANGDSGEADSGGDDRDICERTCTLAAQSTCPPEASQCLGACQAELATPCGPQVRALYRCQLQLTAADFSCNTRGRRMMAPGRCESEQQALVSCVLAPPK